LLRIDIKNLKKRELTLVTLSLPTQQNVI